MEEKDGGVWQQVGVWNMRFVIKKTGKHLYIPLNVGRGDERKWALN